MSELADRRRFERTLHDGVQQDLIALAVRLQLVESSDPLVGELRGDVQGMIEALRALAAEIYPPTLDARGLSDALRSASHVRVHDVGRHPPELEAAVYFYCVTVDTEVELYDEDGKLCIATRADSASRFSALAEAAGAVFYDSER